VIIILFSFLQSSFPVIFVHWLFNQALSCLSYLKFELCTQCWYDQSHIHYTTTTSKPFPKHVRQARYETQRKQKFTNKKGEKNKQRMSRQRFCHMDCWSSCSPIKSQISRNIPTPQSPFLPPLSMSTLVAFNHLSRRWMSKLITFSLLSWALHKVLT
jgi:hypothetical protein